MKIQSFRDLETWQIGMDLVVGVYEVSEKFPEKERYGLTAQLRRAAVAIPSNVAEGHQRGTRSFKHFVVIAIGSLAEAETQIELAERLKYTSARQTESVWALARTARRLLHGLRRSLAARNEGFKARNRHVDTRAPEVRSPIPDPRSPNHLPAIAACGAGIAAALDRRSPICCRHIA
jgi:four helix bundle protein